MIEFLLPFADEPAFNDPIALNFNALLSGGAGATFIFIIWYVARLILDRTIPSRSDARANISIVLESLQSMVNVMQVEKLADAKRLEDRQKRIDQLEESSDADYKRKAELQADIIDLRARLAQKERHIRELIHTLTSLGAKVVGVDTDTLEITLPADVVADEVRKVRQEEVKAKKDYEAEHGNVD